MNFLVYLVKFFLESSSQLMVWVSLEPINSCPLAWSQWPLLSGPVAHAGHMRPRGAGQLHCFSSASRMDQARLQSKGNKAKLHIYPTHSSTLVWKLPWSEEPCGLQSMGLWRVGHVWATSLSLFTFMHWRRRWQPTPVFLPGESQGRGSLVGCHLRGCTESDTTEATWQQQHTSTHKSNHCSSPLGWPGNIMEWWSAQVLEMDRVSSNPNCHLQVMWHWMSCLITWASVSSFKWR